MATEIKRSFAGGEVSPAMYGRADQAKYGTGLRTCRNFRVARHGGVENRPGTKFVCEVKDSSKRVRLIPFIYNQDQSYVLEFGHLYMRVIKNGAQGLEAALNIASITQAQPGVFTHVAHGYSTGEEVYIKNVEGMTQLNNRNFKVVVLTADTFTLQYMDGLQVYTDSFSPYTTTLTTGTTQRVYTIASPYTESDLSNLALHPVKYAQSNDVVNLTHQSYPPYQLTRTGDLTWAIAASSFLPSIPRPTALAGAIGGAGALLWEYKVTAVSRLDGSESLPALQASPAAITGATAANPVVITQIAHGFLSGEEVFIEAVGGMTQINNKPFIIKKLTADTYQLQDLDGSAYTAYTAGGTAKRTSITLTGATPTSAAPNTLTWATQALAIEYDVYRKDNGQWAFLGAASTGAFSDIGAPTNATKTVPIFKNPFDSSGNYPAVVSFHQQRLAFANTVNKPQTIWETRAGKFRDFSTSSPIQDDDSLEYQLAGTRVQEVMNLIELGDLVVLSSGAELSVDGAVTPFSINSRKHSGHGSSSLTPINIDKNALFVQARGSKVRDLTFSFETDGYKGNDLSIFADHLFSGYSLVDWCYQEEPHSIVWAVRNDGVLLGLTYIREQEIWGWHRHDTDGVFENVISVPEGDPTAGTAEDAVYVVVKRTITLNGASRSVRYIERFTRRKISDIRDAIFMDAALTFDGRPSGSITMALTGSGWTNQDLLTLTASSSVPFKASDVGNAIFLTGADGTAIRFLIDGYTSATVITGFPHKTVPAAMQAVAIASWSYAVDQIGGLWHIEGKLISVFADGFVVASPANPGPVRLRVTNGSVTLDRPYAVIQAGLFYESDLETLDIEHVTGQTIVDKPKLVSKITVFLQASRGGFAGDAPPDNDPTNLEVSTSFVEGLAEMQERRTESMDDPPRLLTEAVETITAPKYNKNGRVFIRQVDPLPMSVLTIAPAGLIP